MTLVALTRTGVPAAARLGLRAGHAGAGWFAQLVRFGLVGGAASVIQLALYAFLADSVGAQPANIGSWLVSTLVATEAHRRFSFRTSDRTSADGAEGDHVVGILTSVLTLLLSTVALAALDSPTGVTGSLALVAVNVVVGVLRFVTLRWWMVGRRDHSHATPSPSRSSLDE